MILFGIIWGREKLCQAFKCLLQVFLHLATLAGVHFTFQNSPPLWKAEVLSSNQYSWSWRPLPLKLLRLRHAALSLYMEITLGLFFFLKLKEISFNLGTWLEMFMTTRCTMFILAQRVIMFHACICTEESWILLFSLVCAPNFASSPLSSLFPLEPFLFFVYYTFLKSHKVVKIKKRNTTLAYSNKEYSWSSCHACFLTLPALRI